MVAGYRPSEAELDRTVARPGYGRFLDPASDETPIPDGEAFDVAVVGAGPAPSSKRGARSRSKVTRVDNTTIGNAQTDEHDAGQRPGAPQEPQEAARLRPLVPGMRALLFAASVLVLLAGIQLFVFTGRTDDFFAFTIANPLSALFLGAGYWASVAIEALAARQAMWANARIAVPAVLVFTLLTLAVTLTHLGKLHLGPGFGTGTQIVAVTWTAIYIAVPALMLVLMAVQARTPGADPARTAGLPAWLVALLAVQAVVLLAVGIALYALPAHAAALWPWKLTPMLAQAIGAWLIALGVAAGHAVVERDARRLRPAAIGYILLAVLLFSALARYPHQFEWRSASGIAYLTLLATMLLTGVAGLAKAARSSRVQHADLMSQVHCGSSSLAPMSRAGRDLTSSG